MQKTMNSKEAIEKIRMALWEFAAEAKRAKNPQRLRDFAERMGYELGELASWLGQIQLELLQRIPTKES